MAGKAWLAVAVLLCLPAVSWGEVFVPDPGTYVVDNAGIIDPGTERRLEGWLRELEQKTTAQVKVLTVQSTQGEPFFQLCPASRRRMETRPERQRQRRFDRVDPQRAEGADPYGVWIGRRAARFMGRLGVPCGGLPIL